MSRLCRELPSLRQDKTLASVEPRTSPDLALCGGVQKLLEIPDTTPEERFFLRAYLNTRLVDESSWRTEVLREWNAHCQAVDDDIFGGSRRDKFDDLIWSTLRFPALIPQVWLNWLYAASEEDVQALDQSPSRVDFVAFHAGNRHIIEIDGPSHYAAYHEVTSTYSVDERAYARNLKIARTLQREGWMLTRIARIEVRDAMPPPDGDEDANFDSYLKRLNLVRILPFPNRQAYPPRLDYEELGLPEIANAILAQPSPDDDLPF